MVKPVDLQTLLPRLSEASREQQVKQAEAQLWQEQFAAQGRAKATRAMQNVAARPGPEGARVTERRRHEEKGGRGDRDRGRGGGRPASRSGEAPQEPGKGRRLDLRL